MNFDLLKKLCDAPGIPGQEHRLREIVRAEMGPIVDRIDCDPMGNLIGFKRGRAAKPKKVMIAAHMDEIGFIVKFIDDKGFVRLQPLGGFDPRQLFAQRVVVHGQDGQPLRGVLTYSTKPKHMLSAEEAAAAPKIENFYVDLGLGAEEVRKQVSIGSMVTMDRDLIRCGNAVVGKSLDDRVGVFVMIEAVRKAASHEVDIYPVATVQEEIGLRGATTSAYSVNPDIGVALDVTIASDFPGVSDPDMVTKLGQGVGIKIMDGSLVCHPRLVAHMRRIAEERNIPFQMEVLPAGGTDGGALQRARGGSVSITLSVPTRYLHTVNEMTTEKDIEATINLLAAYLEVAHLGDYAL